MLTTQAAALHFKVQTMAESIEELTAQNEELKQLRQENSSEQHDKDQQNLKILVNPADQASHIDDRFQIMTIKFKPE